MTDTPEETRTVLPVVEERIRVEKQVAPTARVLVGTQVEEYEAWVREDLAREEVTVERVPIDRPVETMPDIRQEGDVTVYPVVEERLVVEKRLILTEELRISRRRSTERVEQPVTLRRARPVIERRPLDQASPTPSE